MINPKELELKLKAALDREQQLEVDLELERERNRELVAALIGYIADPTAPLQTLHAALLRCTSSTYTDRSMALHRLYRALDAMGADYLSLDVLAALQAIRHPK